MKSLIVALAFTAVGCSGFHSLSVGKVSEPSTSSTIPSSSSPSSPGASSPAGSGGTASSPGQLPGAANPGTPATNPPPPPPPPPPEITPAASNAMSALFSPFRLTANQSVNWGGMKLVMQSQGNLVLYSGATALWASGPSGPNGQDCQGQCYASFQTAGNLVLYTNAGASYFASSGDVASGNFLKLSILAPYVNIVNSNHLTVWMSATGPIPPSMDMWEVMTAFAYRHPQEVKQLTMSRGAVFPGDHAERVSQGKLIDRYGVDRLRFIDDILVLANNAISYAATVQILPWGVADWWTSPYELSARYIRTSDAGTGYMTSIVTAVQNLEFPARGPNSASVNNMHEYIDGFGVQDFGGNIGRRWFVEFSQQPIAVDGAYPAGDTTVNEFSLFDLSPADGVYDPQFGHIGYEQGNTGVPGGNLQFWGNVVAGQPAASFFGQYSYGSPTVQSFGPFGLASGQSIKVANMTLTMQAAGNLVLTDGTDVVWAVGGPDGTGVNCQGQCTAQFQAAGNLVLYNGAGQAYWYNTGASATGNQLQISTGYPYISTFNASGVQWQGRPWLTGAEYQQLCTTNAADWCNWLLPGQ